MSRIVKSFIAVGILSAATAASAVAGPVEDRKELMKSVGKAVKVAVPMAKGEAPYDAAAAKEAMQTINGVPDKFAKLFPEGSGDHPKTEASPKIWEDMQGFLAKAGELKTATAEAAEAADNGLDAFKTALFGSVLKSCKGCHDAYRIKKN